MPKKQIEDLSNLVFGLALALGALTLIAPPKDSFIDLSGVLLRFALSFFVLVFIWWVYNFSMEGLTVSEGVFVLNLGLLFLVVTEPFLLSITGTQSGATAYAVDVGGTLLILSSIIHFNLNARRTSVSRDAHRTLLRRRNVLLLASAFFFASIIPILVLPKPLGPDLAGVIWIAVLTFSIAFRSIQRVRSSS